MKSLHLPSSLLSPSAEFSKSKTCGMQSDTLSTTDSEISSKTVSPLVQTVFYFRLMKCQSRTLVLQPSTLQLVPASTSKLMQQEFFKKKNGILKYEELC
jgi:hypothetical protein